MSDTVSSISTFQAGGAFQLKVGARGALIRAFFGSGAMYCGVVFSGTKNWPWFASVTVASAALIAWAVRSIRATRHLRSSDDDMLGWRSVRTFYLLDFALEWAFIAAAFITLVKFERVDLAPQVLGLIIGLHYLPLSKIFGLRQYAWTGWLLVAGGSRLPSYTAQSSSEHCGICSTRLDTLVDLRRDSVAHFLGAPRSNDSMMPVNRNRQVC